MHKPCAEIAHANKRLHDGVGGLVNWR
ncbi:hypothetical protein VCR12J2_640138 [Vibrio coralliirubri]|nr:hypothetical protein VCR12J2_640138 [Vibrio coralliirubri]